MPGSARGGGSGAEVGSGAGSVAVGSGATAVSVGRGTTGSVGVGSDGIVIVGVGSDGIVIVGVGRDGIVIVGVGSDDPTVTARRQQEHDRDRGDDSRGPTDDLLWCAHAMPLSATASTPQSPARAERMDI